jgi:hypothetical protein
MKLAASFALAEHQVSSTYLPSSLHRKASAPYPRLTHLQKVVLQSASRPMWNYPARFTAIVLVALLLSACSGTPYRRYLGIRPDAPNVVTSVDLVEECKKHRNAVSAEDIRACAQYLTYVQWAQELAEAYRSRASLNEYAIYAAGTIALAGLSVVSGLGLAAAASTETIGLVGVSTGFTSGFFGFINNSAKAGYYKDAANKISTALSEASKKVGISPTSATYGEGTQILAEGVSKIANDLETRRYETAAAAATSQLVQQAQDREQELITIMVTARLVGLDKEGKIVKEGDTVVAVTSGIDLTKYKGRANFLVSGQFVLGEVASSTDIKFKSPPREQLTSDRPNVRLRVMDFPVPGELTLKYK